MNETVARLKEIDYLLRSSVPERYKGCTSPVGAVQSYIVELEQEVKRLRRIEEAARAYVSDRFLTLCAALAEHPVAKGIDD